MKEMKKRYALCFKLVRQNQICFPEQALVFRYFIFRDVKFAIIAHHGIQDCLR